MAATLNCNNNNNNKVTKDCVDDVGFRWLFRAELDRQQWTEA